LLSRGGPLERRSGEFFRRFRLARLLWCLRTSSDQNQSPERIERIAAEKALRRSAAKPALRAATHVGVTCLSHFPQNHAIIPSSTFSGRIGVPLFHERRMHRPRCRRILVLWRYDISGLAPRMLRDYEGHLAECNIAATRASVSNPAPRYRADPPDRHHLCRAFLRWAFGRLSGSLSPPSRGHPGVSTRRLRLLAIRGLWSRWSLPRPFLMVGVDHAGQPWCTTPPPRCNPRHRIPETIIAPFCRGLRRARVLMTLGGCSRLSPWSDPGNYIVRRAAVLALCAAACPARVRRLRHRAGTSLRLAARLAGVPSVTVANCEHGGAGCVTQPNPNARRAALPQRLQTFAGSPRAVGERGPPGRATHQPSDPHSTSLPLNTSAPGPSRLVSRNPNTPYQGHRAAAHNHE